MIDKSDKDSKFKANLWALRLRLIFGWGMLVPVWLVVNNSVGTVDKMTGGTVNSWILLVPLSITLMMLGLTVWAFMSVGKFLIKRG